MEKKIEISSELDGVIKIEDGKFIVGTNYDGKNGGAKVEAYVTVDAVIDLICAKIPGTIDDKLGELLKSALKKI